MATAPERPLIIQPEPLKRKAAATPVDESGSVKEAQPQSPYKAMRDEVQTWLLQHTVGKQVYKYITERDQTFQNFVKTLDRLGKSCSKLEEELEEELEEASGHAPCADTVKNHFRDLAGILKRAKRGIWPSLREARKNEITMFWLDCIYIHFFAHGTEIFCEQRADGAYNSTFWDEDNNAERGELWQNRASAIEEFIANSVECECWHPGYDTRSYNALFEEGLTVEVLQHLPVELEYDE